MKITQSDPRRRKSWFPKTSSRKQRGIAIVTVMAVIILMSTLVLSFFAMSKHEQVSARLNSYVLKNYGVRDVALNFAIGQIRQATTWRDPQNARGYTVWTSQPGMVRTFKQNGDPGKLYKLYSAKEMITNAARPESDVENEDMPKVWQGIPAVWVDLNKPIYKPSPDPKDGTVGGSRNGELIYPIVDPNAYSPGRNSNEQAEGFSYDDGRIEGVNSRNRELAMPVRWIYMLQDGTMGIVDAKGTFTTQGGGRASMDNPMIARFAFWTDDESCKININTASEGVFWDTPRAATPEDACYAEAQPSRNEFQRFPGHPAMVCLSSVLFPNRRYYPKFKGIKGFDMAGNSDVMRPLSGSELTFIWDLAPRIGYQGGTIDLKTMAAGTLSIANLSSPVNQVNNAAEKNKDDHLYSSPDELLFRGHARAKKTNTNGENILERALWSEETPSYGSPFRQNQEFIDRVKNSQFLLTAKSAAPEVNMFGHPRISLWPVNIAVPNILLDPAKFNSEKVTPYDTLISLACHFVKPGAAPENNDNFYYLCREASAGRHGELQELRDGRKRVLQMFRYLKRATGESVDGDSYAVQLPGLKSPNNFLQKYPMVGQLSGYSARDARFSDRDVILANMIDYLRQSNLSDPFLKADDRYGSQASGGLSYGGQTTGYCFCGWEKLNGSTLHLDVYEDTNYPMPKGFGRVPTASEVTLVAQRLGRYDSSGNFVGIATWNGLPSTTYLPGTGAQYSNMGVFEISFLVEAFIPAQGAAGVVSRAAASLGWGPNAQVPGQTPMNVLNARVTGMGPIGATTPLQIFRPASSYINENGFGGTSGGNGALSEHSRFGGYSGFRPFGNSTAGSSTVRGLSLITLRPIAILPTKANEWNLNFIDNSAGGSAGGTNMFRLQLFDGTTETVGATDSNLVQSLSFKMSNSMFGGGPGMPLPAVAVAGKSFHDFLVDAFAKSSPTGALFPTTASVQSWVIPHGDYRMTAASRTLGRGNPPTSFDNQVAWNSLVPLPPNKTLHWEPNHGWDSVRGDLGYGQLVPAHAGAPRKLKPDMPYRYEDYRKFLADPNFLTQLELQRGNANPAVTGDFDQGVGATPDGPYIGRNDEGDLRGFFFQRKDMVPYFEKLNLNTDDGKPGQAGSGGRDMSAAFGPNKQVRSAVQFGSLPTGVNSNWPWQTLLFRPDPNGAPFMKPETEGHYGGARRDNPNIGNTNRMPKDHMLLDFFWMPVVEPFAISSTFSTKGKINMNYDMWPFRYIHRTTALHALFKAERMMAIPDLEAANYKDKQNLENLQARYRHFIDTKRTLNQFERKFRATGEFLGDQSKVFKFPSEICELWLVPEEQSIVGDNVYDAGDLNASNPGNYVDKSYEKMKEWWAKRSLTGDNTKESPYANIYPRLTTRSNVFKVHMWVQTIQKVTSSPPDQFVQDKDQITSEYRGSAIVERTLDVSDPDLQNNDFFVAKDAFTDPRKSLDYFYKYRVTEIKQFTP